MGHEKEARKRRRRQSEPRKRTLRSRLWRLTGLRGKTGWDWLQLLIVPLALAGIGVWFTMQQDARQRELEEQRADDAALQAYLDQMSNLLLERDLRESEEGSEVRTLARARTLTVLARLDPSRKTSVMQFLVEAELVGRVDERAPILALSGANLSGANLSNADLRLVKLIGADLSGVDLRWAILRGVTGVTKELLEQQASSLEGATMPDGSKHP